MTFFVYIIFSKSLDEYYTGHSENVNERISLHNSGFFKNAHTSRATDWRIEFRLECESRSQAIKIEKHIKRMKSRKYIENLIHFPDISSKLKIKYQ